MACPRPWSTVVPGCAEFDEVVGYGYLGADVGELGEGAKEEVFSRRYVSYFPVKTFLEFCP